MFIGLLLFIFGVYILKEIVSALEFQLGSIFIAFFVVLGIIWFINEVKK